MGTSRLSPSRHNSRARMRRSGSAKPKVALMRGSLQTAPAVAWSLVACLVAALLAPVAGLPAAYARADVAVAGPRPSSSVSQVVVISLDGLTPRAITRLGRAGAPVLHRMMRGGASARNARTAYEPR